MAEIGQNEPKNRVNIAQNRAFLAVFLSFLAGADECGSRFGSIMFIWV